MPEGWGEPGVNVLMLAEVSAVKVIGGAERVLREQALGLQRRGHRVELLVRMPPHDHRRLVESEELCEHRFAVSRRHEAAFVWTSLSGALRGFDRIVERLRPDAVVIHQSLAGLGPVIGRQRRACGWVYVCHSLAHEEYVSRLPEPSPAAGAVRRRLNVRLRRWCERLVMQRCRRIVVLSAFMQRQALQVHHLPADRMRIISGGADPLRFRPASDPVAVRRRLDLPVGKVVLLVVRNLVPRMGIEYLLEAVASLQEARGDLILLIGGEGPLRPKLENLIKQLNLTEQVRLLGFVGEEALPTYYQAADLVVMPTQELEGFGLVSVEALACGTAVFGTPVGALPEVLARVDPRLLADGTTSEALARGLLGLLRRFRDVPGEQARLGDRGRALVESDWNWDRHAEQLEAVLREACA
jgi:glycosyltransferase involved in cell wall biosynthesis